jgi:hypothetical protein
VFTASAMNDTAQAIEPTPTLSVAARKPEGTGLLFRVGFEPDGLCRLPEFASMKPGANSDISGI